MTDRAKSDAGLFDAEFEQMMADARRAGAGMDQSARAENARAENARAESAETSFLENALAAAYATQDDLSDAGLISNAAVTLPGGGFWSQMRDAIGGWPAVGGLAMATVAGLWIGVAPPAGLQELAAGLAAGTESEFTGFETGFDLLLEEG